MLSSSEVQAEVEVLSSALGLGAFRRIPDNCSDLLIWQVPKELRGHLHLKGCRNKDLLEFEVLMAQDRHSFPVADSFTCLIFGDLLELVTEESQEERAECLNMHQDEEPSFFIGAHTVCARAATVVGDGIFPCTFHYLHDQDVEFLSRITVDLSGAAAETDFGPPQPKLIA